MACSVIHWRLSPCLPADSPQFQSSQVPVHVSEENFHAACAEACALLNRPRIVVSRHKSQIPQLPDSVCSVSSAVRRAVLMRRGLTMYSPYKMIGTMSTFRKESLSSWFYYGMQKGLGTGHFKRHATSQSIL